MRATIATIVEKHLHLVRPAAMGRVEVIDVGVGAHSSGHVRVEAKLLLLLGVELRLRMGCSSVRRLVPRVPISLGDEQDAELEDVTLVRG